MRSLDIGLLIVGTEILQGFTQDTNSRFLARRLTQAGHIVKRRVTVPDDVRDIVRALKALLRSSMDVVIVSGGLGSTPDDVTMTAIGKALGLPLVRNRNALKWIKRKVEKAYAKGMVPSDRMTEASWKMAMVPKGSRVLFNEPGVAPGVVVTIKDRSMDRKRTLSQKVIILPGVPTELRYLFSEQIEGKIIRPTRDRPYFEEIKVNIPESTMHDLLKRYHKDIPDVTIGSYPQNNKRVILRISGKVQQVKDTVSRIRKELRSLPSRNGH